MKRRWLVLLVAAIVLMPFLFFAGCEKKETAQPAPGNIFITRIANPDESFNAIAQETDPSLWGKYLNKESAIKGDDRDSIAFQIGARSANALLAVALDDYDTAEEIGTSIREAADKLNIKAESVETVAKQLAEELEKEDGTAKEQSVKQLLNVLKDEVVEALNSIGNQGEALMIEYGAWIEALRIVSGIVQEDYSQRAADVFRRKTEARYFKSNFQTAAIGADGSEYESSADTAGRLLDLMQADTIFEGMVEQIHQITTGAYEANVKE